MRWLNLLLGACFVFPGLSQAADPTIEELLDAVDDANRGTSSHSKISMHVKTQRYERTMSMEAWSRGTEETLVRITAPAKDAGVCTLMVEENIWNYLPKVDRTMKVPSGMMSGSWMGSHFSNDDLVKETRLSEDYNATLKSAPSKSADGMWHINLIPKPDAPVVWGHLEMIIHPDKYPVKTTYFDEDGTAMRRMDFTDVKPNGNRHAPMRMTLTPLEKEGEFTELVYETLELDVELDERIFTVQSLRR